MKYFFNIFSCLLLAATLVFSFAGCKEEETEAASSGVYPYRILSVGASFTNDAMRYMRDILIQNGVANKDIDIVNAYIGGQTLEGHAMCARFDLKQYTRESFGTNGNITSEYGVTLKSILTSNNWDYIIFQQGSHEAGNPEAFKDADLTYLVNYVKANCPNPNVKIGYHMTWAYAKNSTHPSFSFYGGDQMKMYNAIVNTAKTKIQNNAGFDFIIPAGTAIQNARTVFGDILCSDGYHLNDRGRFIAGAIWVRQLFNPGVDAINSYQTLTINLSRDDIVKIEKVIQDAFNNPFETDYVDNGGGTGETPPFDGSWHSAQWAETFTFDMQNKTFIKMKDEGWGERGTFTYTTGYIPNTFTCTITEITSDGLNWNTPAPNAQLVWIRTYGFAGETMLINGHVYGVREIDPHTGGNAPYRILSIGASFTRDAMTYMRDILVANGIATENIVIVNAYIGGQTLQGHANNAKSGAKAYTRMAFGTNGAMTNAYGLSSQEILESNPWDIVSFQQGAAQAGNPSAYNDDDINYLIEFVKTHCSNQNVKIAFHMTWAYANAHPTVSTFGSQMAMYNAISSTVQEKILPKKVSGDFDHIIPSGTAFQNARQHFGDVLCGGDHYHASDLGRFIAGAAWVREIFGLSIDAMSSYKTMSITLNRDDIVRIDKFVLDAVNTPFQVTPQ